MNILSIQEILEQNNNHYVLVEVTDCDSLGQPSRGIPRGRFKDRKEAYKNLVKLSATTERTILCEYAGEKMGSSISRAHSQFCAEGGSGVSAPRRRGLTFAW